MTGIRLRMRVDDRMDMSVGDRQERREVRSKEVKDMAQWKEKSGVEDEQVKRDEVDVGSGSRVK